MSSNPSWYREQTGPIFNLLHKNRRAFWYFNPLADTASKLRVALDEMSGISSVFTGARYVSPSAGKEKEERP